MPHTHLSDEHRYGKLYLRRARLRKIAVTFLVISLPIAAALATMLWLTTKFLRTHRSNHVVQLAFKGAAVAAIAMFILAVMCLSRGAWIRRHKLKPLAVKLEAKYKPAVDFAALDLANLGITTTTMDEHLFLRQLSSSRAIARQRLLSNLVALYVSKSPRPIPAIDQADTMPELPRALPPGAHQ